MNDAVLKGRIEYADSEGIDRKSLALIRRRFLLLNRDRLERLRASARERERLLIDVLPLLFHLNNPALPGWVGPDVPASISDYSPSQHALIAAQTLSKSFVHERKASLRRQLLGLYLMGSTGTIAYSGSSDLDLWVLHSDDMDHHGRQLLQEKIQRICQFAHEQGARLHCFPMTVEAFRAQRHGRLDAEHAGSTQHALLLDEFYRSAILLAGRMPLWWLIPPGQHQRYDEFADYLQDKKFIRSSDFLDFGNVAEIPSQEFFSGAVWHLYKAIDSPYKSVLKLLLMEAYAQSDPPLPPLSLQFKDKVFAGDASVDDCDPYLMALDMVEIYLQQQGANERMELMRRCFYQKVGERLSAAGSDNWRRRAMLARTFDWQWSPAHCAQLDSRKQWKCARVQEERRALINELMHSYRVLSAYARAHSDVIQINPDELTILGRKLHAAFEKRAGKIEQINPGIAPDISEPQLTLAQAPDEARFALFSGRIASEQLAGQQALRYAYEPIELLCFAHVNGILSRQSQLQAMHLPERWRWQELQAIARAVQQLLPANAAPVEHDDLLQAACMRRAAVFINPGVDPFAQRQKQGLHLVTERSDPLSYGGNRENLLQALTLVRQNSWGEIDVNSFYGPDALAQALHLLLQASQHNTLMPAVEVHCFSPTRAEILSQKVSNLVEQLLGPLRRAAREQTQQLLVGAGKGAWRFQLEAQHCSWQTLANKPALLQALAQPQAGAVSRYFDSQLLLDVPALALYTLPRMARVQVFVRAERERAELYVLDEAGALTICQQNFSDWDALLRPWYVFLTSIAVRVQTQGGTSGLPEPMFFDWPGGRHGHPALPPNTATLRRLQKGDQALRYYGVSASAELVDDELRDISLSCGVQEVSELEFKDQMFRQAATVILQSRRGNERYPIYIIDLALAGVGGEAHSGLYLRHKLALELKLNQALAEL